MALRKILRYGTIAIGILLIGAVAYGAYWLYESRASAAAATLLAPDQTGQSSTVATSDASPDTSSDNSATPTSDTGTTTVLSSQKSGITVDADVISTKAPPPEGYVEYKNDKYGFSFYHLPDGKVTEYNEGGGAMTVVLENLQKVRGMQVFIVPYSEPLITEERFHEDVPSGVRKNVEDATLDGVRAVTFNSTDISLGETREIWVIRNGYLYEITTFSGVGQWFTPIIQSWRFY